MVELLKSKDGFVIVKILIAVAVLGFVCLAAKTLQGENQDALLRIRGRDGAVEVAQQVLDSLKSVGLESIPSNSLKDTTFEVQNIDRKWARGVGDSATVTYSSQVTIAATSSNSLQSPAPFELASHIYAKQVTVTVFWDFKGSKQSIEVTSVIR